MKCLSIRPGISWMFATLTALALLSVPDRSYGQSIVLNRNEDRVVEAFNWLPYGFFSESFGLGLGAGGGYSGWPQDQASVLGAVTLGTSGSYNFTALMSDYQLPAMPRLVINPLVSVARYQQQRIYAGRDPAFGGERAGANDSDEEHYAEVTQWDSRAEVDFRFLLPLGHGRETIVSRYVIDRGLLLSGASGGENWNPLYSGRSTLSLKPGWRKQTLKQDELEVPLETINLTLSLEHDNYDFPFNPTAGSFKQASFKKDFDNDENFGEWEAWTAEATKVFSLGPSDRYTQRVVAVGFWTAYVPTWETSVVEGQEVVTRRPPPFEGASLGGIYRMRAYEDDRWQDKAAMYYSAELRLIPTWQPLKGVAWLDWAAIDWWQWVLFAEAGQVAPSYSLDDLHSDLHADGGVSLRIMTHKAVCRLDFAVGEEGGRVVAMYGHPF